MPMVDMESENAWNKLIPFKWGENSATQASKKNAQIKFESFLVQVPKWDVVFNKIKLLSTKVLSYLCVVCFSISRLL